MMGTMKGWETRRKLGEAHDEAMKAAGAAVERERVRKLVEEMETSRDVEPLCDACDRDGVKANVIPPQLERGWNLALDELLRRLEEK